MTIELIEFKCPSCGHLVGEKEYLAICNEFNKKVQETMEDKVRKLNSEREKEIHKIKENYRLQEERHKKEMETKINQQVQLQLIESEKKLNQEKEAIIRKKDEEIKETKSQINESIEERIGSALRDKEEDHRKQKEHFHLQFTRIQKDNDELIKRVDQLTKTLENVPSEFKGTIGENMLYEDLRKAFPYDEISRNKRGKEMPDVIQTIITEKGDRIDIPILWDNKMGETITPNDIEKAKKYKEIYNTDCCIIVSSKGITSKYSKGCNTLIGKRDDILLVHPKIAVGVAEMIRNYMIEKSRMIKNGNGKASKQIKLYDYITSPARLRNIEEKTRKKKKLDELQRKEENYMKDVWKQRKSLVDELFEIDKNDQDFINDITQQKYIDDLKYTDSSQFHINE